MAQSKVKHKTAFQGVRYWEHPTRRIPNSPRKDRYYTIRYKVGRKDKEEGVGWTIAHNMTPEKAAAIRSVIQENINSGTGPQSYKELKAANKAEAARKRELQEKEAKKQITFGKFFEDVYLVSVENLKKVTTINNEKGFYRKWIAPILGDMCFADIEFKHINKILNNMNKEICSGSTKNSIITIISQVWNYAKKYKIIDGDCPAKGLLILNLNNERHRFLSKEEAMMLLQELKKHSIDVHDMAMFSLFCGLRAGEIFRLKRSDIDINEKSIKIMNPKNSHTRYAWYGPEIEEILNERLRKLEFKEGLLFPGKNKNEYRSVSSTFKKCVDNLGFNDNITDNKEKIVFHSLRHTYASWLAKKGIPAYNIMKLMGHSSFKMMQRYAHLTDNTLKNSASVLNNILDIKNKDNDSQSGQGEQNK